MPENVWEIPRSRRSPPSITRTTHEYDALRRFNRPVSLMGPAALVSGVARSVQRTAQKNGNVKSEPQKYLACEESPIRAFYF